MSERGQIKYRLSRIPVEKFIDTNFFREFEKTNMLKTLRYCFLSDMREAEEVPVPKVENLKTIPIPKEHSALKVFVVLKNIFRHLPDSELANARLVDRHWNFTAMSELVSRRFHLPTIKLHRYSSNQFRDRNYGWYLDFENTRRSLWTDLYGSDCPMLEFRHLHFSYPGRTEDLQKILRSPWLSCVTSLTLSMYSKTCEEFVLDWFLPSLPNLQNLSCFIKPEVDVESAWSDLQGLDQAQGSGSNNSLELQTEGQDRQISSNLHSFSVCFEEACSFPSNLLGLFPRFQDLKLEFGDIATFINCVEDMIGASDSGAIHVVEVLEITLTHKPNLKEQVEYAELKAEALAIAAAKLCNQFRVRQSLKVISMIPAAHFLDFLKELKTTGSKEIKFEVAAPLNIKLNGNGSLHEFLRYLIPEILFKFPELEGVHLQFLQYYSKMLLPVQILSSRPMLDSINPATQQLVKQLHFSRIPAEIDSLEGISNFYSSPIKFLWDTYCQRSIMFYESSSIQGLVELDVQVIGWQDCVEIIDIAGTNLKCVKKLVLRKVPSKYYDEQHMSSKYFFPEVDRPRFPKKWYFGREISRQYEGLPGMQSLEVLRLEQFGLIYDPTVASEIGKKMPRFKLIHLDGNFNNVLSANDSYESLYAEYNVGEEIATSTWPSSQEHVQVLTSKRTDLTCTCIFQLWERVPYPSNYKKVYFVN